MVSVNGSLSSAMIASRLLSASTGSFGIAVAGPAGAVPGPEIPATGISFRSGIPGDMQRLLDYAEAARLASNSDISAAMRSTGADTVVIRESRDISEQEFQTLIMDLLKDHYADDAGFQKALKEGAVTIKRPEDVPEFRIGKLIEYGLYKDGFSQGGGIMHDQTNKFNQEAYDAIGRTGVHQTAGSRYAYQFYASWPDPSLKR